MAEYLLLKNAMNKIVSLLALLIMSFSFAQLNNISSGERLTYRIHYGPLNAGNATLTTQRLNYKGEPHLFVRGSGKTTGPVRTFFKVDDLYESYINLETGLPSFYVRNVKEGGYSQYLTANFNHSNNTLLLTDRKNPANGTRNIKTVKGLQDMLSVFYHLRNMSPQELHVGAVKNLNVWIDDEMFPFQIKVAGVETVTTKFGKISCLKILPTVIGGRVFKSKESVALWVSNDINHVPIAIKAELAVGSLRADIENYSGVRYKLNFY